MPKIISCLCACFFLLLYDGYGQCSVSLGNDVAICSGDSVALGANLSVTGNTGAVTYSWSNGLGSIPNPIVHPTNNTTYTLTVSGEGCTNTVSDNIVVTVKPSPIVTFNYAPNQPCSGDEISFNSNVSNCSGCSYSWNFGDPTSGANNTSTAPNPSHTFVSTGSGTVNYTVTLTVTAANGCSRTYTSVVNLKQAPQAVLTEDVNFTQCLGLASFYASVTDNTTPSNNSNYHINWGDGTPAYNSASPPSSFEHIYTGIDIWTLNYTVTGTNGCTSSAQYTVTNISNPAIGAATDGNTLQCGPVEVCFDLSNYQNNFSQIQYNINFGDGTPIETYSQTNLPDPICHEYSASSCPGAFTFSITAVSNCPTPTVAQITPIMIFTGPDADFTAPANACVNSAVNFTNLTIPGYNQGCNANTNYSWNFGDPASGVNNTSTVANPTHTYSAPGTYTVTLTATNAGNPQLACTPTTITKTICIEAPPVPNFSIDSNVGCVPMTVSVNNTSTTTNTCNANGTWHVSYNELPCQPNGGSYYYPNGTGPLTPNTQFVLQSEGTYLLSYHLQNSCGNYIHTKNVTVNTVPTVEVTTVASGICAGQSSVPTTTVNPCSLPVTYEWTFAGGTPSSATSATAPSVTYPTAGSYDVTLAVTNACGTVSDVAIMQVHDIPDITIQATNNDPSICQGQQTTLTATGGNTYTWSPTTYLSNISPTGNTTTSTPGGAITYTVTGSNGACNNTATISLTVDPLPTITADDTFVGCRGEDIQLGITASGGAAPYTQYSWTPATGLSQTNIPNPIFSGLNSTSYQVSLTDQNGCQNTLTVPVTVNPLPIVEAGPDLNLCNQPIATTLTGYSPVSGGTGSWSGLGVTPNGIFTPSGTGQVTLTYCFENASTQCEACDSIVVTIADPTTVNAGPDSTLCMNEPAFQLPAGTWSGSPLVSPSGLFTPSSAGIHTLVVSQGSGSCLTTDTTVITVRDLPVINPGTNAAICIGDTLQLQAICTHCPNGTISSYAWTGNNLSDANSSNPQVWPSATTSYTLNVTDQVGCTDDAQITITVNPLPVVNAGPDLSLCNQPVATTLTGFSPTTGGTGTWSGPGVTPNGIFTPNGTGTVTLTYCFQNTSTMCLACDEMSIVIVDASQSNAGPDTALCLNEAAFQLPVGTWSGSTLVSPTGWFTPSSPGTHTLVLSQGSGSCLTTDTTVITVRDLPVINAGTNAAICIGDTLQLQATCAQCPNGTISSYAWTGSDLSDVNISNPQAWPSSTTTYTLNVTDQVGCTDDAQITITVNPLPVVNAGPDLSLCNQPVATTLTGFSPTTGGTGAWSGVGVTPNGIFTPNGTGTVTLTYCFQNSTTSCVACDEMNIIIVDPTQVDAGPDLDVCLNDAAIQLPAGTWSGTSLVSPSGLFTPSSSGLHTLILSQGSGSCLTTDTAVVLVRSLPVIDAGANATLCFGDTTQLLATCIDCPNGAINSYTWNGTQLNATNIANPQAWPSVTTTYSLSVIDAAGCTDTDDVTITVLPLPVVDAGQDITLCNQPVATALTGYTPLGGSWSGTHINSTGTFTPNGTGNFVVHYTYTESTTSCTANDSLTVTVVEPTVADAGPDVTLCLNEGVHQLTGFSPATGGTWSGTGVMNTTTGIVQSEIAGVGNHVLTYSTGSGTCLTSDQMTLTIVALPTVHAGPGMELCANEAITAMSGYTPATGGTWEGTGIVNAQSGLFNPAIATASNAILYWYQDPVTGCRDSSTTTVIVHSIPTADFNTTVQGCTDTNIAYSNDAMNATSYIWNLSNGSTLTGDHPNIVFSNQGLYSIQQIAQNNHGCRDTIQKSIEIFHPPVAHISLPSNEGCAPFVAQFGNNSIGEQLSFLWDLALQTSTDTIPANLTYPQGPGIVTYPIYLTTTNFCGSSIDSTLITVHPQPQASFGTTLNTFCSPFPVEFNNTSVGLPNTYLWDFGDGTFGNEFEPISHTYYTDTVSSQYTIWLYLENSCGTDSASHTITVLPNTVLSFFNTSAIEGCEPLLVQFTDHSEGGTNISYHLGNGYGSTSDDNPSQVYAQGQHTIYQYVNNGCSFDTSSIVIHVYPTPQIDFTSDVNIACEHSPVHFTPSNSNMELFWNFGDGTTSGLSQPVHHYSSSGTFSVQLDALTNTGCSASATHTITVLDGPDAQLSAPQLVGCSPFQVCFNNSSSASQFYTWDFGDGNSSNNTAPCHTFIHNGADAATYTVQLIAQDMQLCRDTAEIQLVVSPQPISAFQLPDFDPCELPQLINTNNLSQHANGYQWTFNNTTISNDVNTAIAFTEIGTYIVQLTATNQYGCSSTSSHTYVLEDVPQASLSATPRQGCAPLEVFFVNQSTDATNIVWDFGNGVTSNEDNPSFQYLVPGRYDITLVAMNDNGCKDTLRLDDYVFVFPKPIADFWMVPSETTVFESQIHFHNTSVNAYTSLWYFGDGAYGEAHDTTYTYPNAGIWPVTLTVWNMYGCKAEKKDAVIIHDMFNVYVPNTFTPDDDGINEVFLPAISGKSFIHKYVFRIYDRWGTTLFETNDYDEPWKGDVRGGEYYAKDEVYNWQIIIQLKGSDEERTYQGHVFLLR